MSGRTFDEKEVAEIFRLAATRQEKALQALSPGGGLTLEELKAIGEEAGISPTFIVNAAQRVGKSAPAAKRDRFVGVPIGFTRTVDLPASFDDTHWQQLVAALHDELDVIGETRTDGNTRIWQSDIGQMVVEPAGGTYRLRLKLAKDTFRGTLIMSSVLMVMGLFFMLVLAAKGDLFVNMEKTLFISMFSILGLLGYGYAGIKFPGWVADKEAGLDNAFDRVLAALDAEVLESDTKNAVAAAAVATLEQPSLDLDEVNPASSTQTTRRRTRS